MSRRKDLILLIALIAVVTMWLHFKPAREPEKAAVQPPDPGCDVMLMAVGEVPEGLLERMKAHVQGPLRVKVGLPYLGVDSSMPRPPEVVRPRTAVVD